MLVLVDVFPNECAPPFAKGFPSRPLQLGAFVMFLLKIPRFLVLAMETLDALLTVSFIVVVYLGVPLYASDELVEKLEFLEKGGVPTRRPSFFRDCITRDERTRAKERNAKRPYCKSRSLAQRTNHV
jgi:hypothetical protein